jgi:PilZ domain-containing protein
MSQSERRQSARMHLSLPVRVQGHDSSGAPWEEMTSVRDACPAGVALTLRHAIARGQVLQLTLPLPKRFRGYDLTEPSYRIFGLVRSVNAETGVARVGVMFLGRHPPKGYEHNPGGLFLLPSDAPPAPAERRRLPRLEVFVNLRVRRLVPAAGLREEQTIAENIGKGGARVLTSLEVSKGEVVEVEEVGGPFRARAEVRNVYVGPDHIPRLNLCFLDAEAPAHLVQHS